MNRAAEVIRARQVVEALSPKGNDLRIEPCGTVKSFTASDVTVTIQGVDITMRYAKRYTPVVGDIAIVVKNGSDWWVLDAFAG